MGPRTASVSWINRSRSAGLDKSAAMANACPPALVTARTVSSRLPSNWLVPGSTVLAVTATVAPSAAKRSAIAIPIPRLAPVTRAMRPARRLPGIRGSPFVVPSSGPCPRPPVRLIETFYLAAIHAQWVEATRPPTFVIRTASVFQSLWP